MNSHQIEYEGSDEEIRLKFEGYLSSLLLTYKHSIQQADHPPEPVKKVDYLLDYGMPFVKAWQGTRNFKKWSSRLDQYEFSELVK